jgi:hypothetical protein
LRDIYDELKNSDSICAELAQNPMALVHKINPTSKELMDLTDGDFDNIRNKICYLFSMNLKRKITGNGTRAAHSIEKYYWKGRCACSGRAKVNICMERKNSNTSAKCECPFRFELGRNLSVQIKGKHTCSEIDPAVLKRDSVLVWESREPNYNYNHFWNWKEIITL